MRFTLQSVSAAVATPIDPSVYSESKRRDVSMEESNELVCVLTRGCEDGSAVLIPVQAKPEGGFYHLQALHTSGEPGSSANIGFFDVDSRTGDVWSSVFFCVRYESPALTKLQRAIRQRIGLTDEEYTKVPKVGPMCEPGQKPRMERLK